MKIEITAEERALLLNALTTVVLDNSRYIEDFPNSLLCPAMQEEIKLSDSLHEKIFNAVFE